MLAIMIIENPWDPRSKPWSCLKDARGCGGRDRYKRSIPTQECGFSTCRRNYCRFQETNDLMERSLGRGTLFQYALSLGASARNTRFRSWSLRVLVSFQFHYASVSHGYLTMIFAGLVTTPAHHVVPVCQLT